MSDDKQVQAGEPAVRVPLTDRDRELLGNGLAAVIREYPQLREAARDVLDRLYMPDAAQPAAPPAAAQPAEPVAWQERQQKTRTGWTDWYACDGIPKRATHSDGVWSADIGGIVYQWRPLYVATSTAAARVPLTLTDEQIDRIRELPECWEHVGQRIGPGLRIEFRHRIFARAILSAAASRVPLTEQQMYEVEDRARVAFRSSQSGPRGRQINYWDSLTPWLIREVERAHGIEAAGQEGGAA